MTAEARRAAEEAAKELAASLDIECGDIIANAAIDTYEAALWQPIETAPRDGVPYIARWEMGHRLHGLALMCQYSLTMESIASRAGVDHDGKVIVLEMRREDWPTHWKPLGALPAMIAAAPKMEG